jgi:hypothetical protein
MRISSLGSLKGVDLLSRDRPKTILAVIMVCIVFFSTVVPVIAGSSISSEPTRVFIRQHEQPQIVYYNLGDSVIISISDTKPVFYLKHNNELIQIDDFMMRSLIEHFLEEYQNLNIVTVAGSVDINATPVPFGVFEVDPLLNQTSVLITTR